MFYHVVWWGLSSAAASGERVFPLFAATPPPRLNASPLAIKNTTLDHKLIAKVAETLLRGSAALQAEITPLVGGEPQVGGDRDPGQRDRKLLFLKADL